MTWYRSTMNSKTTIQSIRTWFSCGVFLYGWYLGKRQFFINARVPTFYSISDFVVPVPWQFSAMWIVVLCQGRNLDTHQVGPILRRWRRWVSLSAFRFCNVHIVQLGLYMTVYCNPHFQLVPETSGFYKSMTLSFVNREVKRTAENASEWLSN